MVMGVINYLFFSLSSKHYYVMCELYSPILQRTLCCRGDQTQNIVYSTMFDQGARDL